MDHSYENPSNFPFVASLGDSSYDSTGQLVNSTSKFPVSAFDFSTGTYGAFIFF